MYIVQFTLLFQAYLRKLLPEQSTGDTNSISSSEEISCSVFETSPLAAFRKRGRPRKGEIYLNWIDFEKNIYLFSPPSKRKEKIIREEEKGKE